MARTWIGDRWVKDATVTLPDGTTTRISPTPAQLRTLKTLPDHFRSARFGTGSRWYVGWTDPDTNRQRQKMFAKRAAAERFAAELEDDIRAGRYIDPDAQDKPVRDVAEAWLTSKARIKDSTWARYRRELDNYVLPKWGTTPVGKVTRAGIDAWVQELAAGTAPYEFDQRGHLRTARTARPLAASTIGHLVRATFGGILRYAVAEQWIGRNPMRNVQLPRDEGDIENDLPHLTHAELETVADEAATLFGQLSDRCLLLTLAYAGPRIGEATALRIKDLDLPGRRARIMRTWTTDKQGNRKLGPAKTWQRRWVPLPAFLTAELERLTRGRGPEEFVFTNSRGGAVSGKNWYTRVWTVARANVGLPDHISVHDLRHVAATNAIAAGADVKLVQQMLGHKDATETLNTYSHLWPDRMGEVMDLVEERRALSLAA